MTDRFHYPLATPYEFIPWIPILHHRLGPVVTQHITKELSISPKELWQHNNVFCRWLGQLGLEVYGVRLFRSVPNVEYRLHIDIDPEQVPQHHQADSNEPYLYNSLVKLNFVYSSWGSTMSWYRLRQASKAIYDCNYDGHRSLGFMKEDCEQLYHTACDTACLIHGGRIHTLTNSDNRGQPRLCYSIMIQNTDWTLSWEKAVDIFKPWLGE
jgi:hypothetical protein